MLISIISDSPYETQILAGLFAQSLVKGSKLTPPKAIAISLEGPLGSGKTEFIKGFAKALGVKEKVLSPTFLILKKFDISVGPFSKLYHLDCYRIKNSQEILNLDFNEIVKDNRAIVLIEWGDMIKSILKGDKRKILFSVKSKNRRLLKFKL